MPTYSLVVPAYNEEGVIDELVTHLIKVMDALAVRHGGAGLVQVELENGDELRRRVVDDGRGFDAAASMRKSKDRFGLVSMRERAYAIGADFRVASRPGDGTTVEVALP